MVAKRTHNMINTQYVGQSYYQPFKLANHQVSHNQKKVKDAMDTCPELSHLFDRLDARDKKNLMKYIGFVECEPEVSISERKVVKYFGKFSFSFCIEYVSKN